jgi:hypothetical protein
MSPPKQIRRTPSPNLNRFLLGTMQEKIKYRFFLLFRASPTWDA